MSEIPILRRESDVPSVVPGTVVIGTLHPMGMVHQGYSGSLAGLMLHNPVFDPFTIIGVDTERTARSYAGRNRLIRRFLEGPGEWLLWVDSDMTFEPGVLKRMLDITREAVEDPGRPGHFILPKIVNALAFIYSPKDGDMRPNAFFWNEEYGDHELLMLYGKGSEFWCDATGVAFTLIHRDVFEGMEDPWHKDETVHPDTGMPMGHDVNFFYKAKQAGFYVRYTTRVQVGHLKLVDVREQTYENFLGQFGLTLPEGEGIMTESQVRDAAQEMWEKEQNDE